MLKGRWEPLRRVTGRANCVRVTLERFSRPYVQGTPSSTFLRKFRLGTVATSNRGTSSARDTIAITNGILYGIPTFFRVRLTGRSFLCRGGVPNCVFLAGRRFSFIRLATCGRANGRLRLLEERFVGTTNGPPHRFRIIFLDRQCERESVPLFLRFYGVNIRRILNDRGEDRITL